MGWKSYGRVLALAAWLWASPSWAAESVYRVIYSDDPLLKLDRALVEKVYGAKLYVIPPDGPPPEKRVVLEGVVIPVDPVTDIQWVLGTRNPNLDFEKIQNQVQDEMKDLVDIQEKWDEFRFLERVAPIVMPPEMHQGSEFNPHELPAAEQEIIRQRVARLLKERVINDEALAQDLRQLEAIRALVNAKMGKSIFKVRDYSHSEGRLPKTHNDWAQIYLDYFLTSRAKVKQLEKEVQGTSRSLDHEVVDLPHIEGRPLEVLLRSPERTIVQKMINIRTEVRVHIVEGEILEGATFLRFYSFGKFLPREEIEKIHEALRRDFLPRITAKYGKYSCTPDVVIEEGTGRVLILDMNSDLQSGYFYPEEDLFTTNLYAARFAGEKTSLLKEWNIVSQGRLEGDLANRARGFLERYRIFINDYNEGAFWDRVILLYMDELKREPTADRFSQALFQLARIGLKDSTIFYQFINEVQTTWPELRLPPAHVRGWVRYLNKAGEGYRFAVSSHGAVQGEEITEEPVCRDVLKAM